MEGTSAVALVRGPNQITGLVRFFQQDNPDQPLIVDIFITHMPKGDWVLRVHNYGDVADNCKHAGKQWYELYRFTIDANTTDYFHASFKDRKVGLHDEFNIIGRALSIASAQLGYDTDNVISCQPIGLTGEALYPIRGREEIIHDLVEPYLEAIWQQQD